MHIAVAQNERNVGNGDGMTTRRSGMAPLPGSTAELEEALSLPTRIRRSTFERFFDAHPGGALPAPGYGRALIDFLAWEIDSGRVVDVSGAATGGGSAWWSAVNGFLVLDLRDAMYRQDATPDGSCRHVGAWLRYTGARRGEEQRTLWRAHELSIGRGVIEAAPLLDEEEPAERTFIRLVLHILARATTSLEPTESPMLGETVQRQYPPRYPIEPNELDELGTALSKGR